MNCNSVVLNGINLGCKDNMGGIKEVYIILDEKLPENPFTLTEGMITEIDETSHSFWKRYAFRKQTGSMTSTLTTDDAVGTNYWTTEVSLQFTKMETSKQIEISALCMANTKVIVLDSNNKYWLLGFDNPVTCTSATAQSGQNFGDLNGYQLTLTDMSKDVLYEVSESAMAVLKGNMA